MTWIKINQSINQLRESACTFTQNSIFLSFLILWHVICSISVWYFLKWLERPTYFSMKSFTSVSRFNSSFNSHILKVEIMVAFLFSQSDNFLQSNKWVQSNNSLRINKHFTGINYLTDILRSRLRQYYFEAFQTNYCLKNFEKCLNDL